MTWKPSLNLLRKEFEMIKKAVIIFSIHRNRTEYVKTITKYISIDYNCFRKFSDFYLSFGIKFSFIMYKL